MLSAISCLTNDPMSCSATVLGFSALVLIVVTFSAIIWGFVRGKRRKNKIVNLNKSNDKAMAKCHTQETSLINSGAVCIYKNGNKHTEMKKWRGRERIGCWVVISLCVLVMAFQIYAVVANTEWWYVGVAIMAYAFFWAALSQLLVGWDPLPNIEDSAVRHPKE